MQLTADNKLKKLIVVGDRVLIRLKKPNEKTSTGLYIIAKTKRPELQFQTS